MWNSFDITFKESSIKCKKSYNYHVKPTPHMTISSFTGQKHYPSLPDAATLVSNIDMVLVHSNFLASQPVLLPPNVQMIGCTQCRDARPLPKVRLDWWQGGPGRQGVLNGTVTIFGVQLWLRRETEIIISVI